MEIALVSINNDGNENDNGISNKTYDMHDNDNNNDDHDDRSDDSNNDFLCNFMMVLVPW